MDNRCRVGKTKTKGLRFRAYATWYSHIFLYLMILLMFNGIQLCFIIKCFKWFAYAYSCSLCYWVGFVWLCDDLGVAVVLSAFDYFFIFMWWLCFDLTPELVFDCHSHSGLGFFSVGVWDFVSFFILFVFGQVFCSNVYLVLWNEWEWYINAYVIFLVLQSFVYPSFPHSPSPLVKQFHPLTKLTLNLWEATKLEILNGLLGTWYESPSHEQFASDAS